jgi:hypothetical protein
LFAAGTFFPYPEILPREAALMVTYQRIDQILLVTLNGVTVAHVIPKDMQAIEISRIRPDRVTEKVIAKSSTSS